MTNGRERHCLQFTSFRHHVFSSSRLFVITSFRHHVFSSSRLLVITSSRHHAFSSSRLLVITSPLTHSSPAPRAQTSPAPSSGADSPRWRAGTWPSRYRECGFGGRAPWYVRRARS